MADFQIQSRQRRPGVRRGMQPERWLAAAAAPARPDASSRIYCCSMGAVRTDRLIGACRVGGLPRVAEACTGLHHDAARDRSQSPNGVDRVGGAAPCRRPAGRLGPRRGAKGEAPARPEVAAARPLLRLALEALRALRLALRLALGELGLGLALRLLGVGGWRWVWR
jgi:hypothetical protein